jgi:hypothetical protein
MSRGAAHTTLWYTVKDMLPRAFVLVAVYRTWYIAFASTYTNAASVHAIMI